jgi:hypothetical protein
MSRAESNRNSVAILVATGLQLEFKYNCFELLRQAEALGGGVY